MNKVTHHELKKKNCHLPNNKLVLLNMLNSQIFRRVCFPHMTQGISDQFMHVECMFSHLLSECGNMSISYGDTPLHIVYSSYLTYSKFNKIIGLQESPAYIYTQPDQPAKINGIVATMKDKYKGRSEGKKTPHEGAQLLSL